MCWLLLALAPALAQEAGDIKLSISKDGTVKEVLDVLCTKIDGSLLVRSSDVDLSRKVSIQLKDATVNQVLGKLFGGTDVKWTISGKQIQIYRPQTREPQPSQNTKRTLTGIVADSNGEPVIGAAVMLEGSNVATTTDALGQWTLTVPQDAKALNIVSLGYEDTVLPLGRATDYYTVIKENISVLDESVVVGYGVQKKSVLTAAISSVKSDQLSTVAPTRVDNVLRGMVSGVTITASSGQPGAATQVRVRGVGTINDSNPLYIVDGMPVTGGIEYINPSDVESIEVLKDAASAAIYGSRGANGVILVTTKKGSEGKTTVTYNGSYGLSNPWKKLDVLDATTYALAINEMNTNIGNKPVYDDPYSFGKGTDWQDEVFNRNAPMTDHQVSISGGNAKSNYFISGSYLYQEGIVGGNYNHSNYGRYTLRANNNYTLFDRSETADIFRKLRLGTNITYSHDDSKSINANSERGSVLGSAITIPGIFPVYEEDADLLLSEHPTAVKDSQGRPFSIVGEQYAAMTNPLALLHMPVDDYTTDKIVAGGYAEFEIIKGLVLRSSVGADMYFTKDDGYELPYYMNSTRQGTNSTVWSTITRDFSWQIENTLSYEFTVGNGHNFNALVGQSAYSHWGDYVSGTSYQIRNESQPWLDATDQDANMRSAYGSPSPHSRLASYFGRLSYNYDERYMLELTFRRDGSSNFSPENKWANFPSISAGWNLTNEKFMEGRPSWFSRAKVRASWGMNGNQNIGSFKYTSMMQGTAGYMLGIAGITALAPGLVPQAYSNAALKWEESVQTDLGLDLGFWDNALSLSLDYYDKRTNGMLMSMSLPSYVGNNLPWGNVGNMRNSGFEFDLTWKHSVADFNYSIGLNGSYNKNVLVKLGNETGYQNYDEVLGTLGTISRGENGLPFPFFYGWKTDGIFQSDREADAYRNANGERLQPYAVAGDVKFVDYNGDGVIDDADRTMIGKGMPDWTFGFNLSASWKGFDLSALFSATVGNDIYDATRRTDYPLVNMQSHLYEGRWNGPGTSNRLPRITAEADGGKNQNWRSSDLMVYDGSFLRCRSLVLGYTVPQNLTRKALINKFRVYLSAENLFTLTSYHGFDPEISSGGTSLGIDRGVYPQARTFSAGVNLTF